MKLAHPETGERVLDTIRLFALGIWTRPQKSPYAAHHHTACSLEYMSTRELINGEA